MNLTFLQSFLVVSRKLSISSASRELNISQPALSRQMSQLELEIGATLLQRTNQGINLTDAGAHLRDRGGQIMESFRQLESEVRELDSAPQPLEVGVPPGLSTEWIHNFLLDELTPFPAIRIHELSSIEQLSSLRAKRINLALTREMSNEFLQALALSQPLGIAAPPLDNRESFQPQFVDLDGEKAIINTAPEAKTQIQKIQEFLQENGLSVDIVARRFDTHGVTIARLEGANFAIITKETSRRAFPEWIWTPFPDTPKQLKSHIWATANKDCDRKLQDLLKAIAAKNLAF